jgi:hypothetical protein
MRSFLLRPDGTRGWLSTDKATQIADEPSRERQRRLSAAETSSGRRDQVVVQQDRAAPVDES